MNIDLRETVFSAIGWLRTVGADLSSLMPSIEGAGLKSQFNYQSAIYNITGRLARDLSESHYAYTATNWTQDFSAYIQTYLTEAWLEGMAANDLTQEDMTPEYQSILDDAIAGEKSHLPDLAYWIAQTVYSIHPIDAAWPAIHARLDMWANRWLDIFNLARSTSAEAGAKEEWVVGPTEHCPTCLALNGLVAYVTEWDEAGFRAQNPPNPLLKCKGYNCKCERVPTTKRRSKNVLSRLLDLATSQNV